MKNWIQSAISGMVLERPGQKQTLAEHAASLEANAQDLARRWSGVQDSPANREKLRHITGIERWGQARLRAWLGEDVPSDEYDSYRPAEHLDWDMLLAQFQAARRDTITLARELTAANADLRRTVVHNQYGPLTVRAWLQYVFHHANMEGKRVR